MKHINVEEITGAMIYCRVSSGKQPSQEHDLDRQAVRCRRFAAKAGIEVVTVFRDVCSGACFDRPGLKELIKAVSQRGESETAVIVDDPSRLARTLECHSDLCARLKAVGGVILSPTVERGNDRLHFKYLTKKEMFHSSMCPEKASEKPDLWGAK